MKIIEVKSRGEIRDFIYFPKELYRDDPHWIPPLWSDEKAAFSKKSPYIAETEYVMILVKSDNKKTLGRALIYIDPNYNSHNKIKAGLFGAFESVNDINVARVIFSFACDWLKQRGMELIRGPFNPMAENFGFLSAGKSEKPVIFTPYNYLYYNDLIKELGFKKSKGLVAYDADSREGYEIPERFKRFGKILLNRNPSLRTRSLDKKNLLQEGLHILEISNRAYAGNWGYVPMNYDEFMDVFTKIKHIVSPDCVWFVEDNGKPDGFTLGFPDMNIMFKEIGGRLFPFGFLKLLTGVKKVRDYRLFGLAVLPEYHGRGLDVLLYLSLCEGLYDKGIRLEANYILEDNFPMRNALEKLGMNLIREYTVYEKEL